MTGNKYQKAAMVTKNPDNIGFLDVRTEEAYKEMSANMGDILNAALGLSGETGEVLDLLKKWIFHNRPLDQEHLKKELGDVMWYVAEMCEGFNFNLDEIMQMNVDKLTARYHGGGFNVQDAIHHQPGDI